jgi:hypothetical protein
MSHLSLSLTVSSNFLRFYVALSMFHDTYDKVASTSTSPATVDLSRNSLDTLCHDVSIQLFQLSVNAHFLSSYIWKSLNISNMTPMHCTTLLVLPSMFGQYSQLPTKPCTRFWRADVCQLTIYLQPRQLLGYLAHT